MDSDHQNKEEDSDDYDIVSREGSIRDFVSIECGIDYSILKEVPRVAISEIIALQVPPEFGGFSSLQLAVKLGKGGSELVVLKVLKEPSKMLLQRAINFEIEPLLLAQTDYVAKLYGILEEPNGRTSMVFEYANGGSLKSYISRKAKGELLSVPETLDMFLQVARGVEEVHRIGFVHLDIGAKNILVFRCDLFNAIRTKIADFGISKRAGQLVNVLPINTAAPEVKNCRVADYKNDIFSLGITFAEIVSPEAVEKAFSDNNSIDFASGQRIQLPVDTDIRIQSTIEECWKFDPNLRPSAKEVVLTLEKMINREFEDSEILLEEHLPEIAHNDQIPLHDYRVCKSDLHYVRHILAQYLEANNIISSIQHFPQLLKSADILLKDIIERVLRKLTEEVERTNDKSLLIELLYIVNGYHCATQYAKRHVLLLFFDPPVWGQDLDNIYKKLCIFAEQNLSFRVDQPNLSIRWSNTGVQMRARKLIWNAVCKNEHEVAELAKLLEFQEENLRNYLCDLKKFDGIELQLSILELDSNMQDSFGMDEILAYLTEKIRGMCNRLPTNAMVTMPVTDMAISLKMTPSYLDLSMIPAPRDYATQVPRICSHSHISRVIHIIPFEQESACLIVEKYKETLNIEHISMLNFKQKAEIIYGIAKALKFIHASGYAHQDLSLSRIVFSDEGLPRLLVLRLFELSDQSQSEDISIFGKLVLELITNTDNLDDCLSSLNFLMDDGTMSDMWRAVGILAKRCLEKKVCDISEVVQLLGEHFKQIPKH